VLFGTVVRGFTASSDLAQIEVVSTSGGPLAITTVLVAAAAGVPSLMARSMPRSRRWRLRVR
jgi:hypothetical protein